jgi:predicted pyridoxine 5'-phosphate oxidase superfamily flavin-nucleotide-binding protein
MRIDNPFHEGELIVQQRLGEVDEGRRNGRAISDSILTGALSFIEQQSLAVLGSIDGEDNVWASVFVGNPGFVRALNEQTIEVDLTQAALNRCDPLWTNLEHKPQVGMLIIDLANRRRLRVNGRISHTDPDRLHLAVSASYPTCPMYTPQRRTPAHVVDGVRHDSEPRQGAKLEADHLAFVRSADTFFVASAHPDRGVDASHRGGTPGFIRILSDRKIRVPDYVGNRMYNTLGNFVVNPHAGLVFLDFERNRTLQLVGRAEIQWALDDPANETGGTRRYWDFEIERWLESDLPHQLQWEFLDYSRYNPTTEGE